MPLRLLVPEQQIATIANRMCFCVDLGQIATPTRFWNPLGAASDSLEVIGRPTFDFARPRLRGLAQALAPAYLRIGGTEADRSFYALDGSDPTTPPAPFTSVLHARHLDAVGDFARAVGFELMLTVNAGWGARSVHGAWLSDQTRTLLRYVRTHSIPLTVLELGNEPNAWPYLQRGLAISPERYAQDLLALTSARDDELPGALVAAPATAFFPTIGEVPSIVASCWPPRLLAAGDFQARALAAAERLALPDIVTWHYYPGQSDRAVGLHKYRFAAAICLLARLLVRLGFGSRRQRNPSVWMRFVSRLVGLAALGSLAACVLVHVVVTPVNLKSLSSPAVLDRVAVWGRAVRATTLAVEPPSRRPAVWLGETGSAQAGGQPGVQCRQTLSGSDYGLLHEGTLEPTPEYWPLVAGGQLALSDAQRHHLYSVMRQREGGSVAVFNGVDAVKRSTVLLFGVLKGARLPTLIEKAVELGADELQPVLTQHCAVRSLNVERLGAIAVEASEQSGRLTVPCVREPQPLQAVLDGWDALRPLCVCDERRLDDTPTLSARLADGSLDAGAGVLIGPEGGFSAEEFETLETLPFVRPVSLGANILRAETAALAAMAIIGCGR
ncbi:16s ribosomal RNA methyltransferase [Chrysochromulina tobinii]|uniref:16S rRNA (uracil(1498)-N(3))-methyltransferase n=1 Tax=Chrysochromulina tobinii TaxID=1460289 RepID=A0A0M0J5F4_9EUKA|nr:16s ribosomal RNA methyltransferase [Chrysochromulina tobinii]|eukprot:KOO21831.1 16s ribosomal RNA methyltransferase [Chrysochromulina sp. CCMP291]